MCENASSNRGRVPGDQLNSTLKRMLPSSRRHMPGYLTPLWNRFHVSYFWRHFIGKKLLFSSLVITPVLRNRIHKLFSSCRFSYETIGKNNFQSSSLDIHLHRIDAREKKIRNNVHANIRIHTFENSKREQQGRRKIRSIKGREWNHGWEQESKLQLERNRRQSAISFWPYNCRPQSPYRNKVQVHRKWSCSLAFALLIELIYIYIYRIWTTTHAFPFLASFLPSEIIAPFATLFLSLPFRFPLRSLTSLFGRGIETSNFEATREQPLPRRGGLISELRHATRHFGTWFFLELGQNCFHDFHVIRYCVLSLVYQKW